MGEGAALGPRSHRPGRQPGSPVAAPATGPQLDWHGTSRGVGWVEAMAAQTTLRGRDAECAVLDGLIDAVRKGESRVLVLRGEPGVGKTALLDYAIGAAPDLRLVRALGVESEMELAFAALQQLCAPMLDRLEHLPGPQQEALRVAFGLSGGEAPDRFVVGMAVLGLISETAEERPLICMVDDAQWLDQASGLALAFVARRLLAESVAIVFATREPREELSRLPELVVKGVSDDDARLLLESGLRGPLDERVRDRFVAETRGNPLALLELPRGLTTAELAGGFGLPDTPALADRIEQSFLRRLESVPPETQLLLLTAAAEPVGDVTLLWRAAEVLGIGPDRLAPAESAGLIELDARVRFRHPLVRSAIYGAAPQADRREAHGALAEATDPEVDPDRRAWHRAHAAVGLDEDVAGELERSADRARRRGGVAAAAAFLERAAELTPDPARRGARALAAAQAKLEAGAPEAAHALAASAELTPLDELQRARLQRLRAQIAFAVRRGSDAPPLAARRRQAPGAARPRTGARNVPRSPRRGDLLRPPRRCAGTCSRWPAPRQRRRSRLRRSTCSSTAWRRVSRRATRWACARCVRRSRPSDRTMGTVLPPTAGSGWRAAWPRISGSTRYGTSWPAAASASHAKPAPQHPSRCRCLSRGRACARWGVRRCVGTLGGGLRDRAGDRHGALDTGQADGRRLPRRRGRSARADRGLASGRDREGPGHVAEHDRVRERGALQRPRPLRGGARRSAAGMRATRTVACTAWLWSS